MTAGGIDSDQAAVIANATGEARRAGATNVTAAQFKAGVAEIRTQLRRETAGIRTEIADLETRLILWMVGTVLATAALTFAVLQFLAK